MKTIATTRRWVACLAAFVMIVLGATFALEAVNPQVAEAQSNVRPPAGAVGAAGPGPQAGEVPGGSMGNLSDSEMWRSVRKGISGNVSIPDKKAGQLVQSEGDSWRAMKNGPISQWGAIGLAGIIVLLAVFFLIRGKIRVDHGMSGRTVERFADIERLGHWLLAVSFIILAITGLNITYGKYFLLPVIGKDAFAAIAGVGKWLHNYVAFAFIAGLLMVFVMWVRHNLPDRYDIPWILKGGGIFTKSHPEARKFNAGQKIIFWSVILGGLSLVLSGISLLFPFQMTMFADTFAILNVFGLGLPTDLAPVQEMQLATAWHTIVALILMIIVIAHIYIGTIGMEGAFDAMGTGEVDENWAKEHHSVWAKEVTRSKGGRKAKAKAAPAE